MFWAFIPAVALILNNRPAPARIPAPQPVSAPVMVAFWEESAAYDSRAEKDLLELVNRTRVRAGLRPFRLDEGLSRAARGHASEMAKRRQLSHQFPGESALGQRIAAECDLFLVEAAENVASGESVDRAHDELMQSPPHRENLLRPSYNTIGIGIVRRGDRLYVVQDFGNSMPKYSAERAADLAADSVARKRADAHLPPLAKDDGAESQREACAMSAADSLKVDLPGASPSRYILRYTSPQPDALPSDALKLIQDGSVKAFSVGSCFAASKTYPNGMYWMVLRFR